MIYTFPMVDGYFPDLDLYSNADPRDTLLCEITYRVMRGISIPCPRIYNNATLVSVYIHDKTLDNLRNRLQGG